MDRMNNPNLQDKRSNQELAQIVKKIQRYMALKHSQDLNSKNPDVPGIKNKIAKYISDENLTLDGFSSMALVDRAFQEMCEYSILTSYLKRNDIEEINVNSWEDIKVRFGTGKIETLKETFFSPTDAKDIMIRLLDRESENKMDATVPIVRGHLFNNVRITSSIAPVLDENRGVQASIRVINPSKLGQRDFIRSCTLTNEMFELLKLCLFNGISICVPGATNSGKTTLMSGILKETPADQRLITIEEQTREFDLIDYDSEGYISKEVIHWKTHGEFDMNKLLEMSLTCNPDIICAAEMKSKEAYAAQEAARTGHAVIGTIHANSCRSTYKRMVTLCKMAVDLDYEILYELVTEAFPIVVFTKKLKDNSRKVMEITECYTDDEGKIKIQTLYRYVVLSSEVTPEGKTIMHGEFRKVNCISEYLQNLLLSNGVPSQSIEMLLKTPELIV
ncbi:CpaF/VirB11 family protein [Acetobacterium wieringae]|uniref:CpaF/VirB11 family protein n=1 Tax=Acetobacterium wieringae TaxID=52694 RepID=A0ABY6HIP8_9FIRM|nr:CpaF/VirB11 family protein [Acetobacterium wieringae]UYO64415.1 CpaF/VirB11 family protein [Acetobacterium wieringae]VUZ25209.1 Uncharacterised protein [Acetobacterium wieringae]